MFDKEILIDYLSNHPPCKGDRVVEQVPRMAMKSQLFEQF